MNENQNRPIDTATQSGKKATTWGTGAALAGTALAAYLTPKVGPEVSVAAGALASGLLMGLGAWAGNIARNLEQRIAGKILPVLAVILIAGPGIAQASDHCDDNPVPQIVIADDNGMFSWGVPQGTMPDGALASCYVEIREAVGGKLLEAEKVFEVQPCESRESSFPNQRAVQQLEIECFAGSGESGGALTLPIQFKPYEYAQPTTPCPVTYEPWVTILGQLLCRR